MAKKQNRGLFRNPWLIIVFIAAMILYYFMNGGGDGSTLLSGGVSPAADINLAENELGVFYLDIGQGDAILLENDGKTMLIDTGSGIEVMSLLNFLDARSIKTIDYLLLTHAHEDHIGSAPDVIRRYEIGEVYMPEKLHTTKIFEDTLDAFEAKNIMIHPARAGVSFSFGNAECLLLSPNKDYDDINNSSIVMLLAFGSSSFIFTGDAEAKAERDILSAGYNIRADVLKVGHHGSSTSTSEEFLSAVNPKLAVISLGADNSYGHPHTETMDVLSTQEAQIYRTDEKGTITLISDGQNITVITDK